MSQIHPSQRADRMPGEHQRGQSRNLKAFAVPYYDYETVKSATVPEVQEYAKATVRFSDGPAEADAVHKENGDG